MCARTCTYVCACVYVSEHVCVGGGGGGGGGGGDALTSYCDICWGS